MSAARILAIVGSLRRASWNRRLAEAAASVAPDGIEVVVDDRLRALPLFDEDLERETGDGPPEVVALRRDVAAADAVLIVTPEYNRSVPGVLKNALDWLSREKPVRVLKDKPVAVIGATPGRSGTRKAQAALRQTLGEGVGAALLDGPELQVERVGEAFGEDGELRDAELRGKLVAVLEALRDRVRSK